MVKLSIEIEALHPAIILALGEKCNTDTILSEVNDEISEGMGGAEMSGNIRDKVGKENVKLSVSGKLSGVTLKKDSPAGLLARVNWYLTGSREYYTRIETVTLPKSVTDWASAERFQLSDEEVANRKIAAEAARIEAEKVAKAKAEKATAKALASVKK